MISLTRRLCMGRLLAAITLAAGVGPLGAYAQAPNGGNAAEPRTAIGVAGTILLRQAAPDSTPTKTAPNQPAAQPGEFALTAGLPPFGAELGNELAASAADLIPIASPEFVLRGGVQSAKDWTQILHQLGIGLASFKVIGVY